MPIHRGPVLADTNAIIEAHRVGAWKALTSRYVVETVEKCFEETQTGFQKRRPEQNIDPRELRASLHAVHSVSLVELAAVALLPGGDVLDDGEQALWAHALTRADAWVLVGPDAASMKFGHGQKRRDQLACLGGLLSDIGHPSAAQLRGNHQKIWLDDVLHKLLMGLI